MEPGAPPAGALGADSDPQPAVGGGVVESAAVVRRVDHLSGPPAARTSRKPPAPGRYAYLVPDSSEYQPRQGDWPIPSVGLLARMLTRSASAPPRFKPGSLRRNDLRKHVRNRVVGRGLRSQRDRYRLLFVVI